MATQQELLDTVYKEFIDQTDNLGIKASDSAIVVVSQLTRALKRIVNSHGATAMMIDGKGYTESELSGEDNDK